VGERDVPESRLLHSDAAERAGFSGIIVAGDGNSDICYMRLMAGELDDIEAQVDCPRCGQTISISYRNIRLLKAASCRCGAVLSLDDDTPISTVQNLINEANPPKGENDG
jgi:hypothetical protein